MNPFSQPFTLDPDAKRVGKIAHLPRPYRERLNQALYEGQTAVQLAKWLNEIPEIKTILAHHFGGRPINTQNLTEWKQGGYRDWLRHQQLLQHTGDLTANAGDLTANAGDLTANAGDLTANAGELAEAADGLADSLFGLLTIDYTQTLMNREKQSPEEFEKQRESLSVLAQDIVRLRRCHLNARRVELQEHRYDQTEEKTAEQLFAKFIQWSSVPAIQKAFLLEPAQRHGRLREIFGMPPKPKRDSHGRLIPPPAPEKEPEIKPPGKNQTKIKPNQAKKSTASRSSRGHEALTSSSSSSSSSKNENPSNPADATPSTPKSGGELNSLSQRERDGALVSEANASSCVVHPWENTLNPNQLPIQGEGELISSPSKFHDDNEPDTSDIPIPQITPGKTTQQLIAEIEDYAVECALARKARSPLAGSSGRQSALNENEIISPAASALDANQAKIENPNSKIPKVPLSDYDKALSEGKSHLEALYAQFTPTPEELERRKRANEELRRQSGVPIYEPPTAQQTTTPNPQKFYGPCSSPYTWQGHRPLDNWKVHTS